MKLAMLAGLLLVLGTTGILVCTIIRKHQHYTVEQVDYGILLDAGSSSTRAFIYEWEHKTSPSLPLVSISFSADDVARTYKISPGIGTLSPNVTEVAKYLDPIIDWATSMIPKDRASNTPIYFQGTAGIRQLPETTQGALITSVRFKLQESGFKFNSTYASILSETAEAGYGFVAVNGLYDGFDPEVNSNTQVYGSLDMGGTSAGIAFVSEDHPPSNYSFAVVYINGTSFTIYAQSIDGMGINEARFSLNYSLILNSTSNIVIDPCAPTGFYENVTVEINGNMHSYLLMGASDSNACAAQVSGLVQGLTRGLPTPPIGNTTFIVADHYLDVKKFFKLQDNANIIELEAKVLSFCGLDYTDAMAYHKDYQNEVQNYCFMGNYLASLLRNYYGFDPTQRRILWKEKIRKSPVTWTLGSMMDIVQQIPPDTSDQTKTRFVRFFRTAGGTVTLFISGLLVILGLVLLILQRRKPVDYVPIR